MPVVPVAEFMFSVLISIWILFPLAITLSFFYRFEASITCGCTIAQLKPGLSAYPKDPKAAALSLQPLLKKAETAVPLELRPKTAVRVGAVRAYLKDSSRFKAKSDWVTALDGSQEGAYQSIALWIIGS
ncbi:hypothetical protein OROHE_025415 [Orobanche hederae]